MTQTSAQVARKLLRAIGDFERVMSTIEAHPELVAEETEYRLGRLLDHLRDFVAARQPRE